MNIIKSCKYTHNQNGGLKIVTRDTVTFTLPEHGMAFIEERLQPFTITNFHHNLLIDFNSV